LATSTICHPGEKTPEFRQAEAAFPVFDNVVGRPATALPPALQDEDGRNEQPTPEKENCAQHDAHDANNFVHGGELRVVTHR
jgi:hypothetical protein